MPLFLWFAAAIDLAAATPLEIRGLPFTRFYSLDEIGNVAPGVRLSFDPLGRLAVIHEGGYTVLNDTTWVDMAEKKSSGPLMLQVIDDGNGHLYYGAFGSWGTVEVTESGKLRPQSQVPADAPSWIATANFVEIVATKAGVYFAGWDGVVYWDHASGEHVFFKVPAITKTFALGNRVYIYSHGHHVQYVDVANRTLVGVESSALQGSFIDQTTELDDQHVLVATVDRRLLTFDGQTFTPWQCELGQPVKGRISCLKRLIDGSIAVAVTGAGLYLVSPAGEILSSLTDPEHHRITDLAARERGVLWMATETGVEKLLYRSPVSVFGQRLGLPISWPQVVRWGDRVVVAAGGRVYEAFSERSGATARFQLTPGQPAEQVWAIAANGPSMLVGTAEGVFNRQQDGSYESVLSGFDVSRLVMVRPDFCYVIGPAEIGALRQENGRWSECAPRLPGLGFPAVVHAANESAWIEFGGNRAGRISFHNGQLVARIFDQYPWKDPRWINVGVVGNHVALIGPDSQRIYFDETSETIVDVPELDRMLNQAPFPISRIRQSDDGALWAAYDTGVLAIRRNGDAYDYDATTFDLINDRHLNIQLLPGSDVWFSTGRSLYHVDRRWLPEAKSALKPILVSVAHGKKDTGLYRPDTTSHPGLHFPYSENNVSFRFFSGSYASRRSPGYEFRLNDKAQGWTSMGTGSLLTLPKLREGAYRMDVRVAEGQRRTDDVLSIDFQIAPPWFRTWWAYTFYGVSAAVTAFLLLRWFMHRANARNLELEQMVQARTRELKETMKKLNEETRNTATLAERNRLAGEIHDSVQQGLSGVMLQLDATLKMSALTNAVRSRLSVARNMVSFTRQEVQHAVWDMESPLLEATELGEALQKIAALIGFGPARIEISLSGTPVALSSSTKHHLLRIAQEAITNAVRHASASYVAVRLVYESDGLTITITDDGCGFRPEEILRTSIGHFGLRGMRERASKVGGFLEIHSTPGEGTTIKVAAPLSAAVSRATHAVSS